MRTLLFIVLFVTSIDPAWAGYPKSQNPLQNPLQNPSEVRYEDALSNLVEQMQKLERLNPRKCSDDYRKLFKELAINVALYYGYGDYTDVTVDPVYAAAMVEYLQVARCTPATVVCEFKLVSRTPEVTTLRKMISGKPVTIRIYSSSLTKNHALNMGAKDEHQEKRSERIRASFHRDLVRSDIVFYTGHARYGGGLGFNPQGPLRAVWENVFQIHLGDMEDALAARPSRLKVFGVIGCETDQHYRNVIREANPKVDLVTVRKNVDSFESEQIALGSLNAILGQKCKPEVRASMIGAGRPDPQAVRYSKIAR